MMKKVYVEILNFKKILFLLTLLFISVTNYAQEANCGDGIDNDGDGLIDCFDGDCYSSPICDLPLAECNTVGDPTNSEFATRTQCSYLDGTFYIGTQWRNFNPSGYDTPKSGDVDNDGKVELVVVSDAGTDEGIYIFNPTNCEPEYYIPCTMSDNHGGVSFANVDADPYAEIFVTTGNDGGGAQGNTLRRYDFDGTDWVLSWAIPNYNKRGFPPDIIDFDGNGTPELITYGRVDATNFQIRILTVSDGATLVNLGANATLDARLSWKDVYAYADVIPTGFDPDGVGPKTPLLYAAGPEVILGNRVFTVDIATGNYEDVYGSDPLTSTGAASNHQPWMGGMTDGDAGQKVSLGDINMDGDVDVVVTGQGYMTVYDPLTNRCLYPRYTLSGTGGASSGGGAACIGDVDGNPNHKPEIGVVSRSSVEIARVNVAGTALEKVWSLATTDVSGETTMNFFDFEGDGKAELVYRDMDTIKVYVGSGNGAGQSKVLFQDPYACKSNTGGEHPIIADIDGDNRAEIIASCQEGIRIYRDNKTPWISARSVFNQRAYNYTNINDDLSVPANPQLNHKVPYLNNYLSQLYLIDKTGNPYFPAPDFTVELENVTTDVDLTSSCPTSVKVRLKVCNGGDALADYSIPISFYQNDPQQAGAKFIQRTIVTLSLDANECAKTDPIDVPLTDLYNGNGNNDGVLYFYVNDDGDGMIPNKVLTAGVVLPNSPYGECSYTNNLYGPINIVDCKFAPTIFGPSSDSQNEDAVLQFKPSNGNTISIKDDDGDNQTVTVSLSNSTFSLSATTGLIFTIGDGSNDVSMTFSGTLANINAALLNSFITPNVNYNGSYNMQITTSDGSGSTVAKTIALTFNAVNDLPVLDDVDLSGYDDDVLPITLADFENQWTDNDNELISMVKVLSLPTNGFVKLSGVPVVVNQEILAADLANLSFEPNLNWSGVTFFRYNASDGTAYASVTKRVNLTILSQNDAPILSDVLITTPINTTLTFASANFTINYFDVDGNPLSDIKVQSLPLNGVLEHNGTPISEFYEIPSGQISQLTYIPNTGFAAIDSFQWNASDGTLDALTNMWVKIHVGAPNSAPTLTNFASSTTEDGIIAFSSTDFVSHYTDAESNPLDRIRITSLPTNGTLTLGATPLNVFDEVVATSLDQITFTPDANWYGTNSFSWKATDGILYSTSASTVSITVSSVNDIPVVNDISKSGVENGTATFTAANFTSSFSDTEGAALAKIMVVTLPATGTLKLSGVNITAGQEIVTAQLANITFVPTPAWSGVTDFTWNGSDGTSYASTGGLVTFTYTNVNTAPLLSALEGSTLSYTENAVPFYITSTIVVSDDASTIESATVSITANFKQGEDYLKFTNTALITGSYDALLGILTLRGTDTKANYQAALRNVQYFNLSDAPSSATRTIAFSVTDGSLLSNTVSRSVTVVPANDLPAFSNIESVGWFPNENVPTNITAAATIEDLDDVNLESAVAKFSINYQNGQDVLSFVNAYGIVGNWDASTGTLTLTGSASVANYQAAIRSIKYTNTSDAPNTIMRTVNIYVNDGDGNSNLQFITITPVAVQDPPTLAAMEAAPWAYVEADGANVIASLTSATVTVTDPENSNVIGGTIRISANYQSNQDVLSWVTVSGISGVFDPLTGILTLTGSTTAANYQAALRASLRYTNSSDVPNTLVRTISITLADASGNSNTITRDLTVASTNDTPTLSAINKSGVISSTIPFTLADFTTHFIDRDGNALTKIQVKVLPTNGTLYLDANGNNIVDGGENIVINTDISVATLALGYFKFNTDATARTRTFTWQGNDATVFSANGTVNLVWNGNNAPTVTTFTKTGSENADISFAVANFTYADAESNPMINVQILTLPSNGILYRDTDGDGVVDAGEAIAQGGIVAASGVPIPLSQLKFKPTTNWNGSTTFSWIAQDDNAALDKWAITPADCNITINAVNSAPTTLPFAVTLIEDNIYTFSAGQFAYSDPEANAFTQIQISTAVSAGALFRDADADNVVDAGETLILNSTVAVANLNQIKFKPALDGNGTPYATFQYGVYDGTNYSAPVVVTLNVTAAQEAPVVGAVEVAPLIYTEDDPATSVSTTLTIADIDNNFMNSATVQITGGYVNGEDYFTFSNTPYISGVWNAATGTMTLSGLYLASSYQEALRNVKYANSSNEPNLGMRTVTFMVNDGTVNSVAGTRAINIVPTNDPPFLSNVEVTDILFTENDPAISLTSTILMIDYDDTNIESAQVAVSTNYYNGQDLLSFVNTPNITGSWNATTGVITLFGTDTEANYIAAIKTVKYINLSENPNDLPKKISFTMNDGTGTSIPVTRTINIAKINDIPTAANSVVSTNEDVMKVFTAANFNYYDLDMNALFRVKITSLETAGTLFLDANVNNIVDAGEDIIVDQEISSPSLNKLKLKPAANTVGSPYSTFEFLVSDGTIYSLGSYTMTINVLPLNDAPTSVDFSFTILEDIVRTITTAEIAYSDVESDPFNKLRIVSSPSRGALFNDVNLNGTVDVGETLATNSEILRTAIDNNQFKYKPVLNGNGANYSVFQYRVSDGTSYSVTSNRVTINVTAVNDAPTGTNGSLTANEGVAKAIILANFGFADVDGNSCAKVNFPALPTAGTLFVDANSNGAVDAGEAVVAGADVAITSINAGQLKFLNALNGYGSPYSTISFKVSDGTLYSVATNTLTVNVTQMPDVTLSVSAGIINETGSTLSTVTATLNVATVNNVVVSLGFAGTAVGGGSDYTASSNSITILAGSTTGSITVTAVDDNIYETATNETAIVSISTVTNGRENGVQSQTIDIVDNEPLPTITLSRNNATIAEATSQTCTFTATSNRASSQAITVNLTLSGTASASDYTSTGTTITIAAGATTGSVSVTAVNDNVIDLNETVVADITSVVNATEDGVQQVSTTITDNDVAGFTLSPNDATTITSETGTTDIFTIALSAQPYSNVVINVSGVSTEGSISPSTVTLTPANWNTGVVVTVTGVDDLIDDSDFTYNVTASVVDLSSDDNFDSQADRTISVTNNDNDNSGFNIVQSGSTATSEPSTTDNFTVELTSQPAIGQVVVFDIASSVTTEGTASPATLTFTNANWNAAQTVTVTGVDDNIIDGTKNYNITVSVNPSLTTANSYDGLAAKVVACTNADNDVAGFTIKDSGGSTSTTEAGSTDNFTVELNVQPAGNVVIDVTGDNTEGSFSPSTLTFTAANWNTPQTVTVTGVDDVLVDGSIVYNATLTVNVGSSHPSFALVAAKTLSVTNIDNDTPEFTVSQSDGTTSTNESGTTDIITVVLNRQPLTNVEIGVDASPDATGEGIFSATKLIFTNANWDTPQNLTVTGVDDANIDANKSYTLTFRVIDATSDDSFDGVSDETVSVTNVDNDIPSFTITQIGGTVTSEPNGSDSFTIILGAKPATNVVLNITGVDATEGTLSTSTLTFTTLNWNTAQTVTITGKDDNIVDAGTNYTLTIAVDDAASDNSYDPLPDQYVTVTNTDNDFAGFTINGVAGSTTTSETGNYYEFTVQLTAQPANNVTIALTNSDSSEGTLSLTSLTFTAANWNALQTVRVTGADDNLIDSPSVNYTVTLTPSSADLNFNGLSPKVINLTNTDNDTADFIIIQSGSTATTELGGSVSFTVELKAQPNSDVVISVTSSTTTEGTVSPASLTFTSANWNTKQTVTVTGVDDHIIDPLGSTTITLSVVDLASDNNFDLLADKTVTVANTDNDFAGFTITLTGVNTSTSETGITDIFKVKLNAQPAAGKIVEIGILGLDATEHSLSSALLTFTPANWDTFQDVTITGIDDLNYDGDKNYNLTLAVKDATSDPGFSLVNDELLSVTNSDNDVRGFNIVQSGGNTVTGEPNLNDAFNITLASQPEVGNVVVLNVVSDKTTEGSVSPATLTFTNANWNTNHTVTVTGVDDNLIDGTQNYNVTVSVNPALTTENSYDGLANMVIACTNTDNDVAGLTIVQSDGNTATGEPNLTDILSVKLNTQPAVGKVVVVKFSTDDLAEATVSPASLTFTTANWNVLQNVTVTGVDDNLIEATKNYNIILSIDDALSTEDSYDVYADQLVACTNTNDDFAGITVNLSGTTTLTSEFGATDNFTIELIAQPTSNVEISVTSLDNTEGSVSPAILTFTPANWNSAQTVTVTGLDDNIIDGLVTYDWTIAVVDANSDNDFDNVANELVSVSNSDNDAAEFDIIQSGLSTITNEGATTDDFSVVLKAQPDNNVQIQITGIDPSEHTISSSVLTFTPLNWNDGQTVTLTGVDDNIIDATVTYNLTVGVLDATSDNKFDGVPDKVVSVSNTDNDVAGFTVAKSGLSTLTTEDGTTDDFTIALTAQPASNVQISVTTLLDVTEGSALPASLIFTPANWNTPQTVTVTGLNDNIIDGPQTYDWTLAVVDANSDNAFDNVDDILFPVTNDDNDAAGFTPSKFSVLVSESGSQDFFGVKLNAQPQSNVEITVVSNKLGEATVAPALLTFTPANWSTNQSVTVTGVDDLAADGSQPFNVTLHVNVATSDPAFSSVPDQIVSGTTSDNDTPGIAISAISGNTSESGTSASFSVALNTLPTANVTIPISSSNPAEGTLGAVSSVIFTTANWNVPQIVTVTGVDDNVIDGTVNYAIITAASISTDPGYNGINTADVALQNIDDDVADFDLSLSSISITEGGVSGSFTVELKADPAGDVVFNLTSNVPSEITLSSSSIIFNSSNWNVLQTVTVSATNDLNVDGNISSVLSVAVDQALTVTAFDGVATRTINITTIDNDVAGFSVSKSALNTSETSGVTDQYDVALTGKPLNNVVITFINSNTGEVLLDHSTLTFTPANWDTPQTVVASGVDDMLADGDKTVSITLRVDDPSSDNAFINVDDQIITVVNTDDDIVGISVNAINGTSSEDGTSGSFTVKLNTQPTSSVTLSFTIADASEGSISAMPLVFDASNWNTSQTVTVTGVNDSEIDGDVNYTVFGGISSSLDLAYNGIDANDLIMTNIDNDLAGFVVVSTGGSNQTTEDSTTDKFTVALSAKPSSNVVVDVLSTDLSEGIATTTQLTFTSLNWSTPQDVNFVGVDDNIIDSNQPYVIKLTVNDLLSANEFDGLVIDVAAINADNDAANLTLSKTSGSTSESGVSDNFTIALASQPEFDVILNLANSNPLEGSISATQLIFTPLNWNSAQTVTIAGLNDVVDDGDQLYSISISVDPTSDSKFTSVLNQQFNLINIDDDMAGIVVTSISNNTSESGTQAAFTIVLSSEPTADVAITLSSDDITEGTVLPLSVSFTSLNWNVPQTITVTGIDDNLLDGNITYHIVTQNGVSTDLVYNGFVVADVDVVNDDDDLASFSLSKSNATTTEKGGFDTFTLSLPFAPLSNVVFDVVSDNTAEGKVNVSQVTFTPLNWSTPQTVTITGQNDLLPDGNVSYNVSVSVNVALSDVVFALVPSQTVTVINSDDDSAGFTLSSISGSTSESGLTASFTIVLNSAPTADVVIALSSNNTNEGTLAISQLIFTPLNWNSAQTVTITGVDDAVVDGNVSYSIITGDAVSADLNYSGLAVADVDAINNDNDVTPDVVLSVSAITTNENGSSADFIITLSTAPVSDVVVDIVSSLTTEATVSLLQVTFTSTNWNNPQTITVTGVDDAVADGEVDYTITVSVNDALSDAAYSSVSDRIITGKNGDNEVAGVTISSISNATDENGATATFTAVLNVAPTSDVTISLSSSNTNEGTLTVSEMIFTSLNWNQPQTITVTGVDDAVVDGDVSYSIVIAPAISSDLLYNGLDLSDVIVINRDNDSNASLVISDSNLSTTESGVADDFTISLSVAPASDVVIDITSSNIIEGTVSPTQITFTPLNWNTPQTITVIGVDDVVSDGNVAYTITVSVNDALSDASYTSVVDMIITVENIDNDSSSGITVSLIDGSTSENGRIASFTLVLNSQPSADVTIPLSSSDTSEGTISITDAIFTSLNWNQVQTITVTGVDDAIIDGSIGYFINTGAAVSLDLLYNGIDVSDVAVLNVDNDFDNSFPDAKDIVVSDVVEAPTVIDVLEVATGLGDGGIVVTIETQPTHGTAVVNADSTITYTPEVNYKGDDSFTYTICDWNGDCSTATISLIVDTDTSFYIPDGFSPNGDGVNDYFVIPNLYKYSDVSLEVFNRWGNVVYRSTSYQNDWNGFSNVDLTIGSELPIGAYFYIVTIKELGKSFSGDVYLGR